MKISQKHLLATLIFYGLLFFSPNNKFLVLMFIGYWGCLYALHRSIIKSLLLAYMASLPILVGKGYVVELVSVGELGYAVRRTGIVNEVIVTVGDVLVGMMVAVMVGKWLKGERWMVRLDPLLLMLIVFCVLIFASSLLGSVRRDLSLIHSILLVKVVIVYLFARRVVFLFQDGLLLIARTMLGVIILQAVLVGWQFASQSPTGVTIEAIGDYFEADQSPESVFSGYRPVGTYTHANQLANSLLYLIFMFLPRVVNKRGVIGGMGGAVGLALGVFMVGVSLSRSAWFSLIVGLGAYLFVAEKVWGLRLEVGGYLRRVIYGTAPLWLGFVLLYLVPRGVNTLNSFEIYGSGYTRVELAKKALTTVGQNLWFGVGLGMSSYYSYKTYVVNSSVVGGVLRYFPEPVHNGFLLIISETGVLASIALMGIFWMLITRVVACMRTVKDYSCKVGQLSYLAGLLAVGANLMFQPMVFDLVMVIVFGMMYADKKNLEQYVKEG